MSNAGDPNIAWLAGLIDGEGCFNICVGERFHHRGRSLDFGARLVLSMRTGVWVDSVKSILKNSKILYHVSVRKGQTCTGVAGWRQVQKLAGLLGDYSIVKKPLLLELLKYRPSANNRFPSIDQVRLRADLLDFVRAFNKGKNRQYKWTGEMILDFYHYSQTSSFIGEESKNPKPNQDFGFVTP